MKLSEAVRAVDLFAAYWPSADMPKESAALWARELVPYETEDVLEAIEILGEARQWMPSLAELLGIIRECRNDRLAQQTRALPDDRDYISFAEYLHTHPDELKRLENLPPPKTEEQAAIMVAIQRLVKGLA